MYRITAVSAERAIGFGNQEMMMRINAEFDKRVLLHTDEIAWRDSPMPGVARRPLDRIGEEVARATTIVRYAPGSAFSAHVHGGGEEFIVLDGVFQDESGDFPVGSYVRNPPGSRHTPRSGPGCIIFVKLWQFDPEDQTGVRIDMASAAGQPDPTRPGISVTPLFEDRRETVRLERWRPGAQARFVAEGGAEIFVLDGGGIESGDRLRRHSWLRVPIGAGVALTAASEGASFWIKTGHLRYLTAPPL